VPLQAKKRRGTQHEIPIEVSFVAKYNMPSNGSQRPDTLMARRNYTAPVPGSCAIFIISNRSQTMSSSSSSFYAIVLRDHQNGTVCLSNLKGRPFSLHDRFRGTLYNRVEECEALVPPPSRTGRSEEEQASPFTLGDFEVAWKRAFMSTVDTGGLSTESIKKLRQLAIDYSVSERHCVLLEEPNLTSMLADDMKSVRMERSVTASYNAAKALLFSPDGSATTARGSSESSERETAIDNPKSNHRDGKKLRQFPSINEMATQPHYKDVSFFF
jgi:hypothetical protein